MCGGKPICITPRLVVAGAVGAGAVRLQEVIGSEWRGPARAHRDVNRNSDIYIRTQPDSNANGTADIPDYGPRDCLCSRFESTSAFPASKKHERRQRHIIPVSVTTLLLCLHPLCLQLKHNTHRPAYYQSVCSSRRAGPPRCTNLLWFPRMHRIETLLHLFVQQGCCKHDAHTHTQTPRQPLRCPNISRATQACCCG
jgi:hypothetical protein